MNTNDAYELRDEMDTIRVKAGLSRMNEATRRDFLKKMGAGGGVGGGGALQQKATTSNQDNAKVPTHGSVPTWDESTHIDRIINFWYTVYCILSHRSTQYEPNLPQVTQSR